MRNVRCRQRWRVPQAVIAVATGLSPRPSTGADASQHFRGPGMPRSPARLPAWCNPKAWLTSVPKAWLPASSQNSAALPPAESSAQEEAEWVRASSGHPHETGSCSSSSAPEFCEAQGPAGLRTGEECEIFEFESEQARSSFVQSWEESGREDVVMAVLGEHGSVVQHAANE